MKFTQNVNRVFWQFALVLVVVLSTAWKCENVKKGRIARGALTDHEDVPACYPSPVARLPSQSIKMEMSRPSLFGGVGRSHCVHIFERLVQLEKCRTSCLS
jgi:hypothetical protein